MFLVLSGIFWLSTSLNEYYDVEVDVPLVITDIPKELILTSDVPELVRAKVHGKGYAIFPYAAGRRSLRPISISFEDMQTQSGLSLVSALELNKLVTACLANVATLNSIKPERIELTHIDGVEKTVPVRLVGQIEPASGRYLSETVLTPARVSVFVPEAMLDEVQFVETESFRAVDFADSLSATVALRPEPNTKVLPSEVNVVLRSDVLTEDAVEVAITTVNVPDGITLRTFPARVKVRYTVGASLYRTINTSQFLVVADFANITAGADNCPISIVQTPAGIKSASLERTEVDYLIEN